MAIERRRDLGSRHDVHRAAAIPLGIAVAVCTAFAAVAVAVYVAVGSGRIGRVRGGRLWSAGRAWPTVW
jgi:hypothetical protein